MSEERRRVTQPEGGEVKTKQADALRTDVNAIMARWIHHGVPPEQRQGARYGDFSSGLDYQTSLDQVIAAQRDFEALPAHVRKHCQNDPREFLAMVFDEGRRDELLELGLIEAELPDTPAPAPDPVPAAPE